MNKTLRIGIVGCGYIAMNRHIPTLAKTKGVEIAALCDSSQERASALAKRFGIKKTYTSFSDMLADNIDAVDICTPPRTHASLSIQAMKARVHVMIEKPLALSTKEADEVVAASKKYGAKICVLHNSSFSSALQHAKSLIDNGAIGDLIGIRALLLGRKDNELFRENHWVHSLPGGIFGEVAPHMVWLCLYFLRMPQVRTVYAVANKHHNLPYLIADELHAMLPTDAGVGSFTISYNSPANVMDLDVFGTKSNLHVDILSQLVIKQNALHGHKKISIAMDNLNSSCQQFMGVLSTSVKSILGKVQTGHDYLIPRFVESILNNSDLPVRVEDAREVVRILEMIWPQINNKNLR